jgi:ABC-type dipeptide/oligopeptide/nickel transport system permease component
MMRLIGIKCLSALSVLMGVVLLIFTLFMLFPSAEEITAGQRADAATKAAMRKDMGLDLPKSEQFILYLKDLSPIIISSDIKPQYQGIGMAIGSRIELPIELSPELRSEMERKVASRHGM